MKKEDFIEINEKHIESCKKIIEQKGICKTIDCNNCPFAQNNSPKKNLCTAKYADVSAFYPNKDEKLLQSAKEFLNMVNKNNYIKNDFSNIKVGDRAWCFEYGWGTVIYVFHDKELPIVFKSDTNRICNFRFDGKRNADDINQSLFWNEVKLDIPEETFDLKNELRKLKIKEFKLKERNYNLYWDHLENTLWFEYYIANETFNAINFEEEGIEEFVSKVNELKISYEEFSQAFNEVFANNKE